MNNIFENAKFGDKFITKNGSIGLLRTKYKTFVFLTYERVLNDNTFLDYSLKYRLDGICLSEDMVKTDDFDIVGKYQEVISNEEVVEETETDFINKIKSYIK